MEFVVVVNKSISNATEGEGVMRSKYVIMPGREGASIKNKAFEVAQCQPPR